MGSVTLRLSTAEVAAVFPVVTESSCSQFLSVSAAFSPVERDVLLGSLPVFPVEEKKGCWRIV